MITDIRTAVTKPGRIHESVFPGSEHCKLKYNASETSVFLTILTFSIVNYVEKESNYYQFLV